MALCGFPCSFVGGYWKYSGLPIRIRAELPWCLGNKEFVEASGSTSNTFNGFGDQSPQMFGTWILWPLHPPHNLSGENLTLSARFVGL